MHLSGKQLVPAVLLTLTLGFSQAAQARPRTIDDVVSPGGGIAAGVDPNYTFSFVGGGTTATGTLQTITNGDGSETATSGTITVTGGPDVGVFELLFANPNAPGTAFSPSGFFFYDDQLTPTANPLITNGGLLFTNGSLEINLFSDGSPYRFYDNKGYQTAGEFNVQAIPEASTMLSFGGMLGVGFVGLLRSRRRRATN